MCINLKSQSIANFIAKTWSLLEDQSVNHIVRWSEKGNTFIIKNKQLFCKDILPKYFKHSNFTSFVRQLNMYDFHKVRGSRFEN